MRKIIHSSFELDLSNFKLQDVEQNSIFYDTFFTKYSFPFEIDLVKDLNVAFGFISHYNSSDIKTYFEVKYQHNNKIENAIFEIEEMQQKLSCTLTFGFDELPSFSKKLSELPLDDFNLVGEDIYEHAETIIPQTWPDVNYNFPQVHIDKYSKDTEGYSFFEQILNKRISNGFLKNDITLEPQTSGAFDLDQYNVEYLNKNILWPMPYILHVLKKGFELDGLDLQGNIIDDVRLQEAVIYGGEAAKLNQPVQTNNINIFGTEYYNSVLNSNGSYELSYHKTITIVQPGLYRMSGLLYQQRQPSIGSAENHSFFLNTIGKNYIWQSNYLDAGDLLVTEYNSFIIIDDANSTFEFEITQNTSLTDDREVANLTFELISPKIGGEILPTLNNENKINLKKCVPDITFGDLVKFIKNYLNYDISKIEGNIVYMNAIKLSVEYSQPVDFSMFEVQYPTRKFSQGKSFLLQFADIDSKEYTYQKAFRNINGVFYEGYKTDDKTSTIEINGLPLPLKTEGITTTAHAFEDNTSKVYLVIYNGLNTGGNNFSKSILNYTLPQVENAYWDIWFLRRIKAITYIWSYKCLNEKIKNFFIKDSIFAYNQHHQVKTINKTEIKPDVFEVEIETETI